MRQKASAMSVRICWFKSEALKTERGKSQQQSQHCSLFPTRENVLMKVVRAVYYFDKAARLGFTVSNAHF